MPKYKKLPNLEADTGIIPWAMAEAVVEKAARLLDTTFESEFAKRLVDYLVEHAEKIYAHNPRFRGAVQSEANGGNAGRDYLWGYMQHWLVSELQKKFKSPLLRIQLRERLGAFANGE